MDPKLEQNFASLSIPVQGLRQHYDFNNSQVLLPNSLKNREEVRLDLEAALQASRTEEVDWLTGKEVVAEVNNEESPYHGRSAFRVFSRAAAFEAMLAPREGRFPACPNQEIEFLSSSVKAIRDGRFKNKNLLHFLFPETVAERAAYVATLDEALVRARLQGGADLLQGAEVLQNGFSCDSTEPLDLFWQAALVNAWLEGSPTIPVLTAEAPPPVAQQKPPLPPSPTIPFPSVPPPPSPWSPMISNPIGTPTFPFPTPPPMWATNPFGLEDDSIQIMTDVMQGTKDIALFGGGFHFQRGVVAEYQMIFKPVEEGKGRKLLLTQVDRLPKIDSMPQEPVDPARMPAKTVRTSYDPLDVNEFQKNNSKVYEKARKEAEILWKRMENQTPQPESIMRTGVKRGWIKGTISLRRLAGWGAMGVSVVDFALHFFRRDERGLDGPLTDAGVDPIGSRLALVGAGVGITAATILTGGLSLAGALVLGGVTAGGAALEIHDAFDEEGVQKFEGNFIPMRLRDRDSSPRKPDLSTIQPDLLARLNGPTCKSRRIDSYIWDSNKPALKI